MAKKKPQVGKARTRETFKDEGFATIYINSAQVEISPWDVKIRLGQVTQATEEKLVIGELAHVFMTPEHTKAFMEALQVSLKLYEDTYGKVRSNIRAGIKVND